MKNRILKFNESFFKRNRKEELKPMGVTTTVNRPHQEIKRLSDEELENIKKSFDDKKLHEPRISPYFIQEISDRLYGPDSEDYMDAIKELNLKFRPREGKTGHDIYKNEN